MDIILHADDFGFDVDTCKATIECFEKGMLTSASIMVNGESSAMALDYAKKHPEFSFGVHLTFVDNFRPISDPKDIPSLVNNENLFFDSNYVRKESLLLQMNSKQIVREILSQMKVLLDAGIKISHLDSHGHLHKFPSFLIALTELKKYYYPGLKVRGVQNIFVHPTTLSLSKVLNGTFRFYISHNFVSTDFFYMPANSFDVAWSNSLLKKLNYSKYRNRTIEIGVHPGFQEVWRANELHDVEIFSSLVKQTSHKLINWNQI